MKKWILTDCFLCHQPSRELICLSCQHDLPWRGHACWNCATELPATSGDRCANCLKNPPRWEYLLSPWRFEPPITQLIHQIKFNFSPQLAGFMGKILGRHALAFHQLDPIDLIVPVPLHRVRQCSRLYNQASWIARAVGRYLQCPVDTQQLRRIRHTTAQAKLKQPKERFNNIHAAFTVTHSHPAKHIALIDDVCTTGATVTACIDAWQQQSNARFSVWCLASGH